MRERTGLMEKVASAGAPRTRGGGPAAAHAASSAEDARRSRPAPRAPRFVSELWHDKGETDVLTLAVRGEPHRTTQKAPQPSCHPFCFGLSGYHED